MFEASVVVNTPQLPPTDVVYEWSHYYYGLACIIGVFSVLEGGIKEDELLLYKADTTGQDAEQAASACSKMLARPGRLL